MSAVAKEIREKSENPAVKIIEVQMDLADVKTVSKAIKEIKNQEIEIDVLVLNAGLAYYDPECLYNINSIQVVNHYSHFYLLNELLENLKVKIDENVKEYVFNVTPLFREPKNIQLEL